MGQLGHSLVNTPAELLSAIHQPFWLSELVKHVDC